MGNGMNKVLPGLYLGGINDAQDAFQLKRRSITHVLSIHDRQHAPHRDKVHLCLFALDAEHQNISQFFNQTNAFIHQARLAGGNVLVHCLAGVSRSVSIIVAYIMTITELDWHEALNVVKAARPCANPNPSFLQQLVIYEHRTLNAEKAKLHQCCGGQFIANDKKNARKLLKYYYRFLAFH